MRPSTLLVGIVAGLSVSAVLAVSFPTLPPLAHFAVSMALTGATGVVSWVRGEARDSPRAIAAIVGGLGLGTITFGATYLATHPVLHVDNATDRNILVWLDGAPLMVVPPSPPDAEPPHLRVPYGAHRLGHSDPTSTRPARETAAHFRSGGDHLYAPTRAGCYWVEATAYGTATTQSLPHGALPLRDFHALPAIDFWFTDTPAKVREARLRSGTTRLALQRYEPCMMLGALGCDAAAREAFIACAQTMSALEPPKDCFGQAKRRCASEPSLPPERRSHEPGASDSAGAPQAE